MLIYTICSDEEEAKEIGRKLVEEKLAACTNRWEIRSCFLWEGEMKDEKEVAMLVKTREDKTEQVFARIKELHSYETPAIFSVPLHRVDADYLDWLNTVIE